MVSLPMLAHDVRVAIRALSRAKLFTGAAAATVAAGMAGTTLIATIA